MIAPPPPPPTLNSLAEAQEQYCWCSTSLLESVASPHSPGSLVSYYCDLWHALPCARWSGVLWRVYADSKEEAVAGGRRACLALSALYCQYMYTICVQPR